MKLFADTSGLAAFADASQADHVRAGELVRECRAAGGRLVTTNDVLTELTALFHRPLRIPRDRQAVFFDALHGAGWVEVVHIDPDLDRAAWALWHARPDKEWSLVDCASFVVMQQRRLTDALTTDHHFEQAGFVRLLK